MMAESITVAMSFNSWKDRVLLPPAMRPSWPTSPLLYMPLLLPFAPAAAAAADR
jgi:hypothetical protein